MSYLSIYLYVEKVLDRSLTQSRFVSWSNSKLVVPSLSGLVRRYERNWPSLLIIKTHGPVETRICDSGSVQSPLVHKRKPAGVFG